MTVNSAERISGPAGFFASFRRDIRDLGVHISRAYGLARIYFTSEEKRRAWFLLLTVIALAGVQIYLMARLSYLTADVFNALDNREFDNIWNLIFLWLGIGLLTTAGFVAEIHYQYILKIEWRQFLTRRILSGYLDKGIFNQLELKNYNLDNPDQRIAEDIEIFVEKTLELGVRFLTDTSRGIVFSVILWQVSGDLPIVIGDAQFTIPGYMFWVVLIYAIASTWLVHRVGKPIIGVNFRRQAVEGDFRYHLVRLRENTESIALINGQEQEYDALAKKFKNIRTNWMELLKYQRRLFAVNFGLGQFSDFIPYAAAMPALMMGTIALGGFIQLRGAFASVERSLLYFAQVYGSLAAWKASVDRITSLEDAMAAANLDWENSRFSRHAGGGENFEVHGLSINLPSSQTLIENSDINFERGQNTVITGVSGSGKSTLFRSLSGQWVWGGGEMNLPDGKVMFLPQKAYFPIGSLRQALTYPHAPDSIADDQLIEALVICRMDKFVTRLDESCDWSRVLSGGEQQRLSLARILLQKPDWLFLDEATAALDPATEAAIYTALKEKLPDTTIVSIAHRESLRKYHDVELRMEPDKKSFSLHPVASTA